MPTHTVSADRSCLTPTRYSVEEMFAARGEPMMTHPGRCVVRLKIDGHDYFLKKYWLTPLQFFKRQVARGLHELRMIDWLNSNGFAGPQVVDRGITKVGPIATRIYFLMQPAPGEWPVERYYRRNPDDAARLIFELAQHTARLHDRGFYHRDYSERHIHVGHAADGTLQFRQIDLERARVGPKYESAAAADLKTLAASIGDATLARLVETDLIDGYLAAREPAVDQERFRTLYARARATKTFHE